MHRKPWNYDENRLAIGEPFHSGLELAKNGTFNYLDPSTITEIESPSIDLNMNPSPTQAELDSLDNWTPGT